MPWVDSLLVFLYTGFRILELLDLRITNIDLQESTIRGGTKTKADNTHILQNKVNNGGGYLFGDNGKKISIGTYYKADLIRLGQISAVLRRTNLHP